MQGYIRKRYKDLQLLIKESLFSAYSGSYWQEICLKLFSTQSRDAILKEGQYKTIFTADINETPCLVKKYRNRGIAKRFKSLFFSAKAMHEFKAAVYLHEKGIPTAAPLFVAEIKKGGLVKEGLVVLPFLSGAWELKDLFFHKNSFSAAEKRKIMEDFGRLSGKILQQGVFQYDFSLNNFMIRKEAEKCRLYFIDFERVEIKKEVSEAQKIELLAKLNRVGCQVRQTERLRFLRGYLEADPGSAKSVKDLAVRLQKKTVRILKRDLKRCRLSSIYTHDSYAKIKLRGFSGFCKRGYDPDDIAGRFAGIPAGRSGVDVSLRFGQSELVLKAIQFKVPDAESTWSAMSTLIIAGLPVDLPHVLVHDNKRGFIMVQPSLSESFSCFINSESRLKNFINNNFSEELEKVRCALG